jgi:hypothetical protein
LWLNTYWGFFRPSAVQKSPTTSESLPYLSNSKNNQATHPPNLISTYLPVSSSKYLWTSILLTTKWYHQYGHANSKPHT